MSDKDQVRAELIAGAKALEEHADYMENVAAENDACGWIVRRDIYQSAAQISKNKASELRAQAASLPKQSPVEREPVAWCVAYDDPNLNIRIHSNPSMNKPETERLAKRTGLALCNLYLHPAQQAREGETYTVDMTMEQREPLDGFDHIYKEYQACHGRTPDAFMAKVVAQTKDRLLTWFAWNREAIRAALVAQESPPPIPAQGEAEDAARYRRIKAGADVTVIIHHGIDDDSFPDVDDIDAMIDELLKEDARHA